jgi:hypothetical protein
MLFKGADCADAVWPRMPRISTVLEVLIQPPQLEEARAALIEAGHVQGTLAPETGQIAPAPLETIRESERRQPRLFPFLKLIRVPELDGLAAALTIDYARPEFLVQEDRVYFVCETHIHYNVTFEIDVRDLWRQSRTLEIGGESILGQTPTDMVWVWATRAYFETLLGTTRPMLAFFDVLALLERFSAEIDWARIRKIAHEYALEPVLYYVLRHANELLGRPVVPQSTLRQLYPVRVGVERRRDRGDFVSRLFDGDLTVEKLEIERDPVQSLVHESDSPRASAPA